MPLVIFGGSTLSIGCLTFFLRETESDLCETTQDTKNRNKTTQPLLEQ